MLGGVPLVNKHYSNTMTITADDNRQMVVARQESDDEISRQQKVWKMKSTLVHELTHIWQYLNWKDQDVSNKYPDSDLQTATSIVYKMICNYAMYEEITGGIIPENNSSLAQIQEFASKILKEQLTLAKEIIEKNRVLFDALVDELMEKMHLGKRELQRLLV